MADDLRNHGVSQQDGRGESTSTLVMTPEQSRAARALLNWSQVARFQERFERRDNTRL